MKINTKILIRFFIIILFFAVLVFPSFSSAMTIDVDIPEKFSEVKAGEKVYFQTEVKWPENIGRKDLRIEYSIKNNNGEEVAYLKVLKAIETQASFMDMISIPESTPKGMYKISAQFSDYKDLNEEVVASFSVVKSNYNITTYLSIIIGLLSIVVVFTIVKIFFLKNR